MSLEVPFTFRHKPYGFQQDYLSSQGRRASFGLLWEQGLGKTKGIIDTCALLGCEGEISGALVLAPNGVHRNWHVSELPEHWPEDGPRMKSFSWSSTSANAKWHKEAVRELLEFDGFAFLCLSYDALMTDLGKQASWDFIRSRRVMYAADESQRIKTPAAKRTKRVINSGVYAPYRRIASGTPMDTPFDIYSQVRFLDPEFWSRELGLGGFTAFKAHFGNWVKAQTAGGRSFDMCVSYRNLDELNQVLATISDRRTKDEELDLPPKVYKRMFHELSPAQRSAYEQLRSETLAFLESGELVTAELAIVRILRLQQITSGFVNPEAGANPVRFDPNPRAALLREVLEDVTRPCIIWGRFVEDIRVCEATARAAGRKPVVWNGDDPGASLDPFHAGEADTFIANLESNAREGLTLNEADTTIYYSNTPKLLNRLQSEDRNHRIGQSRSVLYIDLLAEGTLDSRVLSTLRDKRDTAGTVLGDDARGWLMEALS